MILFDDELMVNFLQFLSWTTIFEGHGFVFVEENVGFDDGSVGGGIVERDSFV